MFSNPWLDKIDEFRWMKASRSDSAGGDDDDDDDDEVMEFQFLPLSISLYSHAQDAVLCGRNEFKGQNKNWIMIKDMCGN